MQKVYIRYGLTIVLFWASFSMFAQNTVGLLSYDTEQSFEGYNLIFPHNQPTVFLIDNCGRSVHQWPDSSDFRPGNSVYLMDNGNLVKCKRPSVPINDPIWAGGGGAIVEVRSWDNELLYQFERNDSLYRLHHDAIPMPNGNILMVVWEYRSFEESVQAGRDPGTMDQNKLWSEVIWEWDPVQDTIVWEWRVWDHLIQDFDSTKENYGVIADHPELIDINYDEHDGHPDWLHINAIDYNPVLDQLVLSIPYFNEIWVVDHSTTSEEARGNTAGSSGKGGDLLYRYGNPQAYDQGTAEDQVFFFQHDVQWINPMAQTSDPDFGKFKIFNNRVPNGTSPMNTWNSMSQDGEYLFEANRFGPDNLERTIFHPDSLGIAVSSGLSSVQLLPNGNSLILAGRWGFAYEMTPDNELVWEYVIPIRGGSLIEQGTELSVNNNITFRMTRYAADFAGFTDRDLSPGDFLEINPNVDFCPLTIVSTDDPLQTSSIKVYPNPSNGEIMIEAEEWQEVDIRVFNLAGQQLLYSKWEGLSRQLDLSYLQKGMYLLQVGERYQKIVIR